MAHSLPIEECEALSKAFSGFGVDEKSIIALSAKWNPDHRKSFRKSCPQFFRDDERFFERWEDHHCSLLEKEFSRFRDAAVLWAMHPWQRDARLAYGVVHNGQPSAILIEIACTRSSEELLGARKAYHSLFHRSIEEDVAYVERGSIRRLLVALVSAFRYEGPQLNHEIAKSEAKILGKAIKEAGTKKLIENEDVVRILSTRSKLHLNATFRYYKEFFGEAIEKDLKHESSLQETVQCLSSAPVYFSNILDSALKGGASETVKEALTRVVVSRADVDMKDIKEVYQKLHGVPLANKIKEATCGNYKDFLLAVLERSK